MSLFIPLAPDTASFPEMPVPLDPSQHKFANEFYVVAKTIEVVVQMRGESERIRIDALENLASGDFSTKAYREEGVSLTPQYTSSGPGPLRHMIWVDFDLPWTLRQSADDALDQALGFLSKRCS